MGMHQDIGDQRREYSRVEVSIPFEYRIVLPEEKLHLQARISGDNATTEYRQFPRGGNCDPVLEEWLKILNSKLDTIISLMKLREEESFGLSFKAVNISGGGMSFCLPESILPGKILEIKIVLTFQQPVVLSIYGEVVKVAPINDGYFTAVTYVHMDDVVRDEIVRFVFEREREIIREKRR
jgi:c-di-GMP-binding flagellar brake protein YcgR